MEKELTSMREELLILKDQARALKDLKEQGKDQAKALKSLEELLIRQERVHPPSVGWTLLSLVAMGIGIIGVLFWTSYLLCLKRNREPALSALDYNT
jgi:cytoskeletal protein RodZ